MEQVKVGNRTRSVVREMWLLRTDKFTGEKNLKKSMEFKFGITGSLNSFATFSKE